MTERLFKTENKILKILILGGGPIGLFIGYKLLKKGNIITIFEKRKTYTRHNILSLKETNGLDTLSLIPSEIMDELNTTSSFANINAHIDKEKCQKSILRKKPYLTVSSRVYYIVLNELEMAYNKYFTFYGGKLIKPETAESFTNISLANNILTYSENDTNNSIDISKFDIIFVNDGANSYYRNIYFNKTSYTEHTDNNIFRYGLNPERNQISVTDNGPLAYGLIFLHDIENKQEFGKKFNTEDKHKTIVDFNSVFDFDFKSTGDFTGGLTVKEILIDNKTNTKAKSHADSQNLCRMFVCENYLYISILLNPADVGDFVPGNQNLIFDTLPESIKTYLMFTLYYFDLTKLIDPMSKNNTIKIFPLFFSSVKQSCSFIRKTGSDQLPERNIVQEYSTLRRSDSYFGHSVSKLLSQNNTMLEIHNYQFIALCGDAMASGNFHAGIVLNKNLIAANNICILIEEYIDAYPKDADGNLNNNFLRLLFFKANLFNQEARDEIIKKSIDALINFYKLDNDNSLFNLPNILSEFKEIFICKNCIKKNKLTCKNSMLFIKYIIENADNKVLQKILRYMTSPDEYKYT